MLQKIQCNITIAFNTYFVMKYFTIGKHGGKVTGCDRFDILLNNIPSTATNSQLSTGTCFTIAKCHFS